MIGSLFAYQKNRLTNITKTKKKKFLKLLPKKRLRADDKTLGNYLNRFILQKIYLKSHLYLRIHYTIQNNGFITTNG